MDILMLIGNQAMVIVTLVPLTLVPLTLVPLTLVPLTLVPLTLVPLTLVPLTLVAVIPVKVLFMDHRDHLRRRKVLAIAALLEEAAVLDLTNQIIKNNKG